MESQTTEQNLGMGRSVMRPSICTFNDFPGDAGAAAGLKATLWELLLHTYTQAFLTISFRRIMLKVID